MSRMSVALALALLGCRGSSPTGAQPERTDPPQPPGPPSPSSGVDELPELEGQPRATILARFGEPNRAREFAMAECCTEFQIELYNTYPPDAGHDAVRIHEWTWTYAGYALTIWLHEVEGEWRVLETSRYSDDVEF